MTARAVSFEALEKTRKQLFAELPSSLDDAERKFLRSVHRLDPDWALLDIPNAETLPAIRWKIMNLEILKNNNPGKFNEMLGALDNSLRPGK